MVSTPRRAWLLMMLKLYPLILQVERTQMQDSLRLRRSLQSLENLANFANSLPAISSIARRADGGGGGGGGAGGGASAPSSCARAAKAINRNARIQLLASDRGAQTPLVTFMFGHKDVSTI